ncbi:uncharacterized protein FIBRA_05022 [Fibroporia radiculosa]|uniref:dual-specificity kinase n=1 Tax=Fibroporia radiculosa TaxID=599839 RepID=J4G8D1_9APHY|nr:uncharacterized protein FIBRA_05022 [Fibroporia radiculosa]CCM02908.1 predicted protein [Fibroporia radiculosa]
MSAPPSPHSGQLGHDKGRTKKKDRPPTLVFGDPKAASDGDVQYERDVRRDVRQPVGRVRTAEEPITLMDAEAPRSASATSSLDPYYFSVQSPSSSPLPALPSTHSLPKTPEMRSVNEPVTPGKDPAAIDRRGLVGVGELATPRWARGSRNDDIETEEPVGEVNEDDISDDVRFGVEEAEKDMPDSPWTIEAVDGDPDDKDQFLEVKAVARPLRSQRSVADESGGEEILYPRHRHPIDQNIPDHPPATQLIDISTPELTIASDSVVQTGSGVSPPSAFASLPHRPRKRTSDEFEMDYAGVLVSKHASIVVPANGKEKDKASVRRHRSLGVGSPSAGSSREKAKDRRTNTLSVSVKHSRQASASSSSSSHGETHPRRAPSDFSHLPPSPSSSSIKQFLRHGTSNSNATSPLQGASREKEISSQLPANVVAHSLLRGTQEGWSDLDDQTTAAALRKLDGLSSRSTRTRSSIGPHSRLGSLSRPSSRPSTPGTGSSQWEGIEGGRNNRRTSTHAVLSTKDLEKVKEPSYHRQAVGSNFETTATSADGERHGTPVTSGDDRSASPLLDKPLKKSDSINARSNFTPKRGSASSGTFTSTPTTSSRDSATLSISTSATSVSATSGRQSANKARRNSASSDISSSHTGDATSIRDRAAALATHSDTHEENPVPPVPPLPKDISQYKPQRQSSNGPVPETPGVAKSKRETISDISFQAALDVPSFPNTPSKHASLQVHKSTTPTNLHKTPSKKWSFTNALGKKLSNSPSTSSMKDATATRSSGFPISPRSLTFGAQLRKSVSRENPLSSASKTSTEDWSQINGSATSLASVSSVGSVSGSIRDPLSPAISGASLHPSVLSSRTPDRLAPSRSETASSASTNVPIVPQAPLSPTSSIHRHPSSKRLTPSSIPFFRRSSSQSMQLPPSHTMPPPPSPTSAGTHSFSTHLRAPSSHSPIKDTSLSSPSAAGSAHKKSSVLSLGLPSLLKGSSSRRSLHSDKEKSDAKSGKESHSAKESDKEKQRKDDKERSESRISVLMGRKRGKTLSSAQPKKIEPVPLPPMQISALPAATAQRVASLKSTSSSSLSSNQQVQSTKPVSSRATSQTVSSMQKQSDTSLRSRNQLPTIAGSPSVGSVTSHVAREAKEAPPSSSLNPTVSLSKETPTKIPRISSRSSTANSPTLKANGAGRRASLLVGGSALTPSRGASPTAGNEFMNEFGVLENGHAPSSKPTASSQRHSIRASPSTTSRVPRQVSASTSTTANSAAPRKNRESMSFAGLRKSSTGSVASISSVAQQNEPQSSHRFSALSPSKGLKLLSPKMSLPTSRSSNSSSTHSIQQAMASPSTSRQSLSTPSPAPSSIDEEELLGDEEMLQYIRRQQAKKLAAGATQEELDGLLRFPEPIAPTPATTPAALLKSAQVQYLSNYECKEILDFPSVYCIGANSDKKRATWENSTNNHGYDDERGDYLVVNHDHLAYRYEIFDTLGKGSFGQVLNCRDHCTGESVAIKIIRNKKRFHHQALVEIKILDSLRKWDQDEKHHVIKMTEHFYFRGHLCIAMELLSINLYELIKANGFVGFTTALIRRFTSQMLQSLSLMRHHRIVHCDLKPENVLLRHPAKSAIKVIDFGSSCFEHEKIYTYIQSRFYRSPEVILGMNYHMAIDMWSLGCILAELYTGFPIFPGENEQEQLSCIMEILGVPDKDFVNRSSRKRLFFDTTGAPRPVVNSKGRRRRPGTKSLAQVLRCDDEQFVDFIAKCLVWDPERRIKPQAALRHPFVTAGRRAKITSPTPGTAKALLSSTAGFSNRSSKHVTETPKKSMISAPTPLTARSTRTNGAVPSTPSTSSTVHSNLGSSRTYRTSQAQSMSSYHSSRTMVSRS